MEAILKSLLILAVTIFAVSDGQMVQSPVVSTHTGRVQGHLVVVNNSNDDVYEFTGIPFAEPPTDGRTAATRRRFAKPTPKSPWTGIYSAVKLPPQCPQYDPSGIVASFAQPVPNDENCLHLNIWVPKKHLDAQSRPNKPTSLPVFFWIYGGGFLTGAASLTLYNGTVMSAKQNVIFVAIQYRLGALGFAYLGTNEVPGNMAMWDQVEALKWVNKAIAAFGGDPNQVTIAGESAGAASVTSLLLSPHSRPFISKAIIQSGAASATWASMTKAEAKLRTERLINVLAKVSRPVLQCKDIGISAPLALQQCVKRIKTWNAVCLNATEPNAKPSDKLECLRGADFKTLLKAQIPVVELDRGTISPSATDLPWVPVVDGDFLPRDPLAMIADGDFAQVPILIGSNKDEGALLLRTNLLGMMSFPSDESPTNDAFDDFTQETFRKMIKSYFVYYPANGIRPDPLIHEAIEMQYWSSPEVLQQKAISGVVVANQVKKFLGDSALHCPVVAWADAFAKYKPVYHYFFTHRSAASPYSEWAGVTHGDELPFSMGDALNENDPLSTLGVYTPDDKACSKRMIQFWSNFVKTGDPNKVDPALKDDLPLPKWPVYRPGGDALQITGDGSPEIIIESIKSRDCTFWMKDLPEMNNKLLSAPPANYSAPLVCDYSSASYLKVNCLHLLIALAAGIFAKL